MTAVDLAQVQRRAQRILDVAQLTVGQVDRAACVDGQQFDAANAALREHVAGRWGQARDLAALALVLVDEVAVSRALIDDLEARLASAERPGKPVEAADVLDTMANPHPRLMREAKEAHRLMLETGSHDRLAYWYGFRDAMAAATGETVDEIGRRVREWSP
jgi:hypothetical protein